MVSNGFGSRTQKIIFHVELEQTEQVATKLGINPFKEAGEPVRAYFAWTRLTTRPGNDEDVVWDLSVLLDGRTDFWEIVWNESAY